MIALRRWLVTAAVCAALFGSRSAAAPVPASGPANASALAAVPAQAPIVFQLRGVERTKDRLTAFLNAAMPDLGPGVAAQMDQFLKNGFEGRKLQGLAKDGPIFLVMLELPGLGGGEPPMAVIARVTDYKAFRDGALNADERKGMKSEAGYDRAEMNGRDVYFLDRQDFAVVTANKDAAEMLAKKPAGLDGKLTGEVARPFLENDVGLYVNLSAVNKEYGDQIKQAQQTMEQGMAMLGGANKEQMEFFKLIFSSMFQGIADGRALVVALDFRPEGLNVHAQFQVGADTKTNSFLKDQKPTGLDAIGQLPAGLMSYTASDLTGDLLKSMAPIIYGAASSEGEAKAQVEAAVKQLIAAGLSGSYSAANVPPAGVQVQTFKDPAKGAAAMLGFFRAMGEGGTFQNAYIKGKPEIKENAQEYKGFKLNYVHVTWDLDKLTESVPGGGEAMKSAMKKLLGDGIRAWFGTDGKQVVTVTANDWDTARGRLDAYLGGSAKLANEPAYTATRKELPAETSMLMLADAGPLTQKMGDYMLASFKALPQLPLNLPDEIKPVKTKTSYLGFAVTLRPENAGLDVFVPAVGMQEIQKVLKPVFLGGAQ
jgi:hypothetical protein